MPRMPGLTDSHASDPSPAMNSWLMIVRMPAGISSHVMTCRILLMPLRSSESTRVNFDASAASFAA